ncbi:MULTISPECIES: hypothetical protein [Sphingobacterium]|uniref:hypothetical protein n=2 Tax=Sphingobacteriaceae TaxID=84566 RepID=UPI0013DAE47B|nr:MULTISPECIES: hypothetical protein [unclassified Sphingobacterium]
MVFTFLLTLLVVALIAPVRWWPNIYNGVVYGKYEYYDFHIETLGELLYQIYGQTYGFVYIFSLILVLLPFQIIKSYCYNKNNRALKLWKKCLILFGIMSVVFAFLFRPPMTEMRERLELFAILLALGTLFALILYFCVDRYVERSPVKQENDN